jgi:2-dehydropantoate 2-reductase
VAITIYGTGAIGGTIAAYLAKSGEDILCVDQVAEHVDAMAKSGLRLSGSADFSVRVGACRPDQLSAHTKGSLGVTFLAVKSQHTSAALDVLAPLAGPETVIVSLQNGMNPPRIAERVGAQRTVGTFVNFGADWAEPGRIEFSGTGAIYIGELDGRMTPRVQMLESLLSRVMPAHATPNIYCYLWAKQIYLTLLFAQTVSGETMADTYANRSMQALLSSLVREGIAIATAAGVKLEGFDGYDPHAIGSTDPAAARASLDGMDARARGRIKARSGPWRDIQVRKRPTEVDYMLGWLVAEGKRLGVEAPLIAHLHRQVKEIEAGARPEGMANLEELERHRRELAPAPAG